MSAEIALSLSDFSAIEAERKLFIDKPTNYHHTYSYLTLLVERCLVLIDGFLKLFLKESLFLKEIIKLNKQPFVWSDCKLRSI